jgi:hypothetical protein
MHSAQRTVLVFFCHFFLYRCVYPYRSCRRVRLLNCSFVSFIFMRLWMFCLWSFLCFLFSVMWMVVYVLCFGIGLLTPLFAPPDLHSPIPSQNPHPKPTCQPYPAPNANRPAQTAAGVNLCVVGMTKPCAPHGVSGFGCVWGHRGSLLLWGLSTGRKDDLGI